MAVKGSQVMKAIMKNRPEHLKKNSFLNYNSYTDKGSV